jgi:nitroreductase
MELRDVIRHRKMWRAFEDRPVDPDVVERILDTARRAPSAGFSQGFAFLLLQGREETAMFWNAVSREADWPTDGTRKAPVLIVPMAGKDVYLDRYAEQDKGWGDRDEERWPVPYWIVDASFASMLILLAAVDEGLGALFFGLEADRYEAFRDVFRVPAEWAPIGVIAMGHKAPDSQPSSRDTRPRKPFDEVVHRGQW